MDINHIILLLLLGISGFLPSTTGDGNCGLFFFIPKCTMNAQDAPLLFEDDRKGIIVLEPHTFIKFKNVKYKITRNEIMFKVEEIGENAEIYFQDGLRISKTNYYEFKLKVENDTKLLCEETCTVFIKAVNQYRPRFLNILDAQKVTVEENKMVENALKTLDVEDEDVKRDIVFEKLHFSIKEEEERNFFRIEPAIVTAFNVNKGKVKLFLKKELDFEYRSLHVITVVVKDVSEERDNAVEVHTEEFTIYVDVKDVHDQPPQFVRECGLKKLEEQSPKGTNIATVLARDADIQIGSPIKYSILNTNDKESSFAQKYFQMDENSGLLSVKEPPDREGEDLEEIGQSSVTFFIEATEYNRETNAAEIVNATANTTCIIQITDIDDNSAEFEILNLSATISENSPENSIVTMEFATVNDRDMGENAKYSLFLSQRENVFTVNPEEGMNNISFFIRVDNSAALDYEREDLVDKAFFFEVTSIGKLNSNHVRHATVRINLTDENDNYPIIEPLDLVEVSENASDWEHVATVVATDKDSGYYGTAGIVYQIPENPLSDSFHIDNLTGEITVKPKHSLDREKIAELFLPVEAVDNLGKGLRNFSQIRIKLLDANDQKPQFTVTEYRNVLYENEADLQSPTTFQAFDRDEENTPNSMINFELVDDNKFSSYFKMNNSNGLIQPKQPLDFEDRRFNTLPCSGKSTRICIRIITLEVRAYDLGVPRQYSEENAIVTIEFTDVNDNWPKFVVNLEEAYINETIPTGEQILEVKATDADIYSPNYNQVFYSFVESKDTDNFIVNRKSGSVTVVRGARLAPEDNEGKEIFVVQVEASDGNDEHPETDVCIATIHVHDVNNVAPKFQPQNFKYNNVTILEEQDSIWVVQLHAYDPDKTSQLEYAIAYDRCIPEAPRPIPYWEPPDVNTYDLRGKFTVDKDDGRLYVTRVDRERLEKITLVITVTDMNADSLFPNQVDEYQYKIQIIDINDNAPMFINNNTVYGYNSSEKENVKNDNLLQIRAIDIDGPGNNEVRFLLALPENAKNTFEVETMTGVIKLVEPVDYEEYQLMTFTVKASDNGVPSLSATALVNVTIIDVNDNKPVFANTSYEVEIKEDVPVGTSVIKVLATDRDSGDFGLVHYDLTKGNDDNYYFSIGKESGLITVKESLIGANKNYELKPTVRAFDNPFSKWNDSLEEIQMITVKLQDVNKYPPIFKEQLEPFMLSELENIKVAFGRVEAIDDDRPGINSAVEYFLVVGDSLDLFQVDLTTGQISPKKSLHKKFGSYDVTIMAKDKGVPPRNSTKVFHIVVYDENDHSPVFVHKESGIPEIVSIPEDTINYPVTTVKATDEDNGLNGTVTYAFLKDTEEEKNNASFFNIDEDTGKIIITKLVFKKDYAEFTLIVTATDRGTPPLSSTENYVVIVKMKSDNDLLPYFEKNEESVNFTEHTHGEVHKISKAYYRKEFVDDPNAKICYFIIGGDIKLFRLNNETRELWVRENEELDREVHAFHTLYVMAQSNCEKAFPPIEGHIKDMRDDVLNITIGVTDINDHPPIFIQKTFGGKMTTKNTQKNDVVLQVLAEDLDEGINAKIKYSIYEAITSEEGENLDMIDLQNAFIINEDTGAIRVNFEPKSVMKGYFRFKVIASDIDGLNDTAEVLIYLMREDQQIVIFINRRESEITDKEKNEFVEIFTNITEHLCIAGKWEPMEDDGSGKDRTKIHMHLVNKETNKILSPGDATRLVDDNMLKLRRATQTKFPILTVTEEDMSNSEHNDENYSPNTVYIFMAVVAGLAITLVVATVIFMIKFTNMRRTLKAATATAFGSQDSGLNRLGVASVPNTNQHTFEGSNPVWNQREVKFNHGDIDSETGSVGSLDIDMMKYPESDGPGKQNPVFVDSESTYLSAGIKPPQGTIEKLPETNEDDTKFKKSQKKNKAPEVPKDDKQHFHKNTINTLRMADKNWRRRNTQTDVQFDPNDMPLTCQPDEDQQRRLSLFIQRQKSSDS